MRTGVIFKYSRNSRVFIQVHFLPLHGPRHIDDHCSEKSVYEERLRDEL